MGGACGRAVSALSLPAITAVAPPEEVVAGRRVKIILALLFFNVMSFAPQAMVIHIPDVVGKLLTQLSLTIALLLALTVNRRFSVRPNLYLSLWSVLAVLALMISVRDEVSIIGSNYRAIRFIEFVAVLWLLSPWWGRRDLLLPITYLRYLLAIMALALLGLAISPHKAFAFQGRLAGDIWPISAPQLAHYAAVTAGLVAVLWLSGLLRRNLALVLFLGSMGILLLTHTRTALVAMMVGLLAAGISLFSSRRRVRSALLVALMVGLIGSAFIPTLTHWFVRGQNSQEFTSLTGRTDEWSLVVHTPRTEAQILFGFGPSNNSIDGLPIDNSWLAVYQDQGLVGDIVCGLIMLCLLLTAVFRPRGPARALAIYLIVYCLVASFTETGLGEASSYLLDLTIAASLLAPPMPLAVSSDL